MSLSRIYRDFTINIRYEVSHLTGHVVLFVFDTIDKNGSL